MKTHVLTIAMNEEQGLTHLVSTEHTPKDVMLGMLQSITGELVVDAAVNTDQEERE